MAERDHEPLAVPSPEAGWDVLWPFALTYNGYERHGNGRNGAGDIANRMREEWDRSTQLPDDLDRLRCALFFEQRRYHHFGHGPEGDDELYVRKLVGRIERISGGSVPGPGDSLP